MKKVALIFGVTGQDGAYLSKFLLKKKYKVHGVKRRSSSLNTSRIDDIYKDPFAKKNNFILHYGDITDSVSVYNIIKKVKPNEALVFEKKLSDITEKQGKTGPLIFITYLITCKTKAGEMVLEQFQTRILR